MSNRRKAATLLSKLAKCPTGIHGLDDITGGGLPRGRSTLVCGAAGSGKTLLAIEFIVRGIQAYQEPGVFVSFDETSEDIAENVVSLGWDLAKLVAQKRLAMDYVYIERSEIEETGEYDLEGLFVRLGLMIDSIRAKRLVLDSLEALFAGLPNEGILRAELRRLFRWLKAKGVTAIITGEQGQNTLTRHGLEEYVSDCVIFLGHRVLDQIATRSLRIVKYRGSQHGTSEYPTMIDATGLSVLPFSSLGLTYPVSTQRVPTGVPGIDDMLGKKGYFRGTSVLVSGTAGTGKTSLAVAFTRASCARGEKCVYLAFEESPQQILRNMRSIGYDLEPWMRKGLLHIHSVRPSHLGLESHLVTLHSLVNDIQPAAVVIDPISNLTVAGDWKDVRAMLTRAIDFLKNARITALFTSLMDGETGEDNAEVGVSSLMDTWLLLKTTDQGGERGRSLYVLKSRGMEHSHQVREFHLTKRGFKVIEAPDHAG